MSKKKKQIQDQWSAIPPPSSHKIPRQRQKSLHCKPTLQQAINKAASIQTPPLHCKPSSNLTVNQSPQNIFSVQDKKTARITTMSTFDTSIIIHDLNCKHFIDPLRDALNILNQNQNKDYKQTKDNKQGEDSKQNKITSPSIFFSVAVIPVNVFQPHRQSCYIITFPPDQYHIRRTRIEFTQKEFDYFTLIDNHNLKQIETKTSIEQLNLLEPHIISKAFPIFSSMYTLLENSSVPSLIDNIEENISSTLTTPLVAGVEINMLSEIQALEITMYISMRFTEYSKAKSKYTLPQMDVRNTLTLPELFILIAHERMQCPIVFTNYEQDSTDKQFRVIDILDSRKIKEEITFINKKIKHKY